MICEVLVSLRLRRRWEASFFSVYHPFSGQGGIEINGRGIYLKGGETGHIQKNCGDVYQVPSEIQRE